jgi:hypothetical protein
MRVLLGVFALAVIGSTAFAVSELRALERHASQAAAPVAPALVEAVEPAAPRAVAPPLSTWKEALPFGGVPGADESETDAVADVPDSDDRCPDGDGDGEGEDGCPDITKLGEPPVILIDGRNRIISIDEQRRIILPEGQSPMVITLEAIEFD